MPAAPKPKSTPEMQGSPAQGDQVRGKICSIPDLAGQVARLRAVVERVEKLADAWEPTHGNCGCAWCDLYDDLRAALAPEATR